MRPTAQSGRRSRDNGLRVLTVTTSSSLCGSVQNVSMAMLALQLIVRYVRWRFLTTTVYSRQHREHKTG